MNITFSKGIVPGEEIIKGRAFGFQKNELKNKLKKRSEREVSLEFRFADRLGIGLGDSILFDIQGEELQGRVTNLRKVKWTTFRPNFFIKVSALDQNKIKDESDLDGIFKTFLGIVPPLGDDAQKREVKKAINRSFPNVSMVDVSETTKKVMGLVINLLKALKFMAIFAFLEGLIILYTIIFHQIQSKTYDLKLLKILGGPKAFVKKMLYFEILPPSSLALFLGVTLATVFANIIGVMVFDRPWSLSYQISNILSLKVLGVSAIGLISILIISIGIINHRLKKIFSSHNSNQDLFSLGS